MNEESNTEDSTDEKSNDVGYVHQEQPRSSLSSSSSSVNLLREVTYAWHDLHVDREAHSLDFAGTRKGDLAPHPDAPSGVFPVGQLPFAGCAWTCASS